MQLPGLMTHLEASATFAGLRYYPERPDLAVRAAPEVFPDADKLGKQLRYASTRGVRFVVVCGDDERAAGTVAIKDLVGGAQITVPRPEAAQWLVVNIHPAKTRPEGGAR